MKDKKRMVLAMCAFVFSLIFLLTSGRAGSDSISTWQIEPGIRFERDWIGAINIVNLQDGTYRMYYTGGAGYPTYIQYAESSDGLSWTYKGRINFVNGAYDDWYEHSDTMILPDGTFRMYFCHGIGIASLRQIYRADSVDGIQWTIDWTPAIARGSFGTLDWYAASCPNIVKLGDGSFRMYYHGNDGTTYRILSAISFDGISWAKESGIRIDIGGPNDNSHAYAPQVLKLSDGTYIMFYTGGGGNPDTGRILSAVSQDGLNWIKENGVRIDPAQLLGYGQFPYGLSTGDIVPLLDNQYRMYFSADRYPLTFGWGRIVAFSAVGSIEVQPANRAPVAKCKDVTVPANSFCFGSASIDDGSYDPDGDPVILTQSPTGPYPLGSTTVTLTVTDGKGASSQNTAAVTVVDTTPPTIGNVWASPAALWPPNNKMVDVMINYTAMDNCGPVIRTLSVTSNEPVSSSDKDNKAPDWEIVDAHHVKLRAERLGGGNGRIYTITVTCMDNAGNKTEQTVTVNVPHDQGK